MRCIFSCLGNRKSRRKLITIPSKDQDERVYEITIEGERIKLPLIHSQEKHEDPLDGVIGKNVESESYSKEKSKEKQKTGQNRSPIRQAHSDSSMSSLFSYPINNRYKNNSRTDDDQGCIQPESSDSLFSISVNSKIQLELGETEVNSPMKVRELPPKENNIVGLDSSRLNPVEKITRLKTGNMGKLIMMDDQEEKENVKDDQERSLRFSSEDSIFERRLNFSEAEKESEFIRSDHNTEINSNIKPIENLTQANAGLLGDLILIYEQEDKENIKSEQEINKQRSDFSEENIIIGSNHAEKTISLLNPIENLTQLNTGESRRFDGEEENAKIITCRKPSFRNSSKFSKTKVKEILVDTSLSSWLVESERESDSPKSVKNSPDRENNPLSKYNDDNSLNEKDIPIVGTIGSFLESNSMPTTPQARTMRFRA